MIRTATFIRLFLFLLCTVTAHAADNPLKPFSAQYTVKQDGDLVANTSFSLTKDNNNLWQYHSKSTPTGWLASMMGISVSEQSEWVWQNGIKVLSYRYDRSGKEKHVYLTFDWPQMKVTNNINGDPWHMKIPDATQDKLSINLALMAHLAQSEVGVSIPVADGGKLKTYDYRIIGKEALDTALGRINTIKLSRNKRGRKDKQALLWLAPELNYLLVRMDKPDRKNELVTLQIQSLN